MTIVSARFQFYPRRERLRSYLNATHGGFDEWFRDRLTPIRERLRGVEAKGVNIVNFLLCEPPRMHGAHAQWTKSLNNFQFTGPGEEWFRQAMFSGPQLELAMANARRDVAPALKQARYLERDAGPDQ
jgi:hypothetical protein